jgi:hypothetical protein
LRAGYDVGMLSWLLAAALGPAGVALPVDWAAGEVADAARRWFRRLRHTDDLSRLVRAAAGTSAGLSKDEFGAVRGLLEDPRTWRLLGTGTVDELIDRIAACLPSRTERTSEQGRTVAAVIARGLLEFAVADLEPANFQRVLMARLDRMAGGQADALDEAMLAVNLDLAAHFARQDAAAGERFAQVTSQLRQIVERLPAGAADRGQVSLYLASLARWLSTNPWAQDARQGGPPLPPADVGRKLRFRGASAWDSQDADLTIGSCWRLVVVGDAGSGKTWLARRSARRCAEQALADLAAGAAMDEVELPLYTTCSALLRQPGDIRQAVVAAALESPGDLGGSNATDALRTFFGRRPEGAPAFVVIDSLDEAGRPEEAGRFEDLIGHLYGLPWPVLLTSRPGPQAQLAGLGWDPDEMQVGTLLPLRLEEIYQFIGAWFRSRPEAGRKLSRQLADRPELRQAAHVPLLLAFYCILGGEKPLPDSRHDLYRAVLRRVLLGRWRRRIAPAELDLERLTGVLREWAWSGAKSLPSGIGDWPEEIGTGPVTLDPSERAALDHVAVPVGPQDPDTGMTLRRFIHRSLREHLVAEHVAALPAADAAAELVRHLWYDQHWKFAAPEALAAHPQRDEVLRTMLHQAGAGPAAALVAAVDRSMEIRTFLARVAQESAGPGWPPDLAAVISQARRDLARSGLLDGLEQTPPGWEASNGELLGLAVAELAAETSSQRMAFLAGRVARLAPAAPLKDQVRARLLEQLTAESRPGVAVSLAEVISSLDPAPGERQLVRSDLISRLHSQLDPVEAIVLAEAAANLEPGAAERERLVAGLIGVLAREYSPLTARLADAAVSLAGSPELADPVRTAVAGLLARENSSWCAAELTKILVDLGIGPEQRDQALSRLAGLMASHASAESSARLAGAFVSLAPDAGQLRAARGSVLQLLLRLTGTGPPPEPGDVSAMMALAQGLSALQPDPAELDQARGALSQLLAREDRWMAATMLAQAMAWLRPAAADRRQTRDRLLDLSSRTENLLDTVLLASAAMATWLLPGEEERALTRHRLLRLVAGPMTANSANTLAGALAKLGPTPAELARICQFIFDWVTAAPGGDLGISSVALTLAGLEPTAAQREASRDIVLGELAGCQPGDFWLPREAVRAAVALAPDPQARTGLKAALVSLLASQPDRGISDVLAGALAGLSPTVADLAEWRSWAAAPSPALLAEARRHSDLAAWIAALTWLPGGSQS